MQTNPQITDAHADHEHVHAMPMSVLIAVLAALLVLTVATVAVTYVDLGDFNIYVAMAVALVKATLVGLYFMHLRYDSPFHSLALVASLLFVAIFIVIASLDKSHYQELLVQ